MEARLILASFFTTVIQSFINHLTLFIKCLSLKQNTMKLLALAIAITAEAFKNTLDKGGQPYVLHCLRVMNNVQGDEDVKCAAIMHDLIEDTHWKV